MLLRSGFLRGGGYDLHPLRDGLVSQGKGGNGKVVRFAAQKMGEIAETIY